MSWGRKKITEEEFTEEFIAAAFNKNQDQMRDLCHKTAKDLGEDKANEVLNQACDAIDSTDESTGNWVTSWFGMGCCNK